MTDMQPSHGATSPPPPPGVAPAPPPPLGSTPPPPGATPPAPAPPYGAQPGFVAAKPPRPDVKLGAILTVVGSILSIVAVYLPWLTVVGETQNGTGVFLTSDLDVVDNPGAAVIMFAVITAGLGIALFFAGRVLAVAIIAIVGAAISLLIGIGLLTMAVDTADFVDGSLGAGAVVQAITPLVTLAGAIVATAKRRRWPTA